MLATGNGVEQVARWKSASARPPAASALLKKAMPWSVWKWYLTQNFSPALLITCYVCYPNHSSHPGAWQARTPIR